MLPNYAPYPGFVTVASTNALSATPTTPLTGGTIAFIPNAVKGAVQFWALNPPSTAAVGPTVVYTKEAAAADDPTSAEGRWIQLDVALFA